MVRFGAADSGDVLCGLRHNHCTIMEFPQLSWPSSQAFLVCNMFTIHVYEHRVAILLARNMISDVSRQPLEMDHNVRVSYHNYDRYNGAYGSHALIVPSKHLEQILNFLLIEFHGC